MKGTARSARTLVALCLLVAGCATSAEEAIPTPEARAPRGVAPPAPVRRPTGLTALSGESSEVPLWWQPVLKGAVTGYRVYRRDDPRTDGADGFVEIGRVRGAARTTFVDRGDTLKGQTGRLADGRTYVYAVAAEGPGWVGERSDPVTAVTAAAPAAPFGLEAAPRRPDQLLLSWEPSRDAQVAGYRVYRSAYTAGPFDRVGEVSGRYATTYADHAARRLVRLRTYYYRVASLSAAGSEGPPSEPVAAWLKPAPLPPLDLAVVGGLARHLRLRWSRGYEHDLRGVIVLRAERDGPFTRLATLPAARTEYTDGGLADGATYRYRLVAVDTDGLESAPSEEATATTRSRPEPPREVQAVREAAGVRVRWQPAPPSAGVVRYRLVRLDRLRRSQPIAEVAGPVAEDPSPTGGRYAVVAIDLEGLESPNSEPVAPDQAPTDAPGDE